MKKNMLAVLILVVLVVNLTLTGYMIFTVVPNAKRTDDLITKIMQIIDLELESPLPENINIDYSILDVEKVNLDEMKTNLKSSKERYIKWCDTYLPCTDRGPDSDGMAYLTGEILWNIKDKLFSNGNIDIYGRYEDFDLQKMVLRIEERKAWDIYCDVLGERDVVTNVTKFCSDMIYQADRCFRKHEKEVKELSQLPIEDYDAELESMRECEIATRRISELIKGK